MISPATSSTNSFGVTPFSSAFNSTFWPCSSVPATFLQEQFEPYGAVGRVGGDEFAVMIEEEMSQEVLEKELEQFFQNISGIQKEVTVSCSIGVYRFTYPKTIKELLTKTDEILYEAKANGRGCFVIR